MRRKLVVIFSLQYLFVLVNTGYTQCFYPPNTDNIIHHDYFSLNYNEDMEQADWVCHLLTSSMINGNAVRKNNFKEDKTIKTGSAQLEDYKNSGYDRGHLAPAADFKFSQSALDESFLMSNMSPQDPKLNRGKWKELESEVRKWAISFNEIHVISGPIYSDRYIGINGVNVPEYFFKIIYVESPYLMSIAFLLPNDGSVEDIFSYTISIDELEQLTNIDFFHTLPNDIETILEQNKDIDVRFRNFNDNKVSESTKVISSKSDNNISSICLGVTKKGLQCKNRTKDKSGYCHLHKAKN